MNVAASITGKTVEETLKDIEKAEEKADIIEIRFDKIKDPSISKLEDIISNTSKPTIVTNRHRKEGGSFTDSEKERIKYLQHAVKMGVEYVDIELGRGVGRIGDTGKTDLIVSHHDFDQTPVSIRSIFERMTDYDFFDIGKIAVMAEEMQYGDKLLSSIKNINDSYEQSIIGVSMGENGEHTRVLNQMFGSYLTFASLSEDKKAAPGQLTIDEVKRRYDEIYEEDISLYEAIDEYERKYYE